MPLTEPPLLGKRELAKFLGISEGSVTRMVTTGNGPKYYRVGLFVKFRLSDVQEWLEGRAVAPTGDAE